MLRQLVREFLVALSGLERDVVLLALKGMSYRQIAAALGRNTKVVDNALNRAKRKANSLGLT